MAEEKKQNTELESKEAPVKTSAQKKAEKDKVPVMQVPKMSPPMYELVGRVAFGSIGMKEAREALRRWVAELNDEEKELLKAESDRIGRTMVLAAEGLSQELTILVSSL